MTILMPHVVIGRKSWHHATELLRRNERTFDRYFGPEYSANYETG